MEYERIDKIQNGISPSKLRMKLMGPHHSRKKDGSNTNSSRTSPSRIEDSEFINCLLTSKNGDFDEEVKVSNELVMDSSLDDEISSQSKGSLPRESIEVVGRAESQEFSKSDTGNSSSVHSTKTVEDENLDSDSNASSSSFEFHKGERAMHASMTRSHSRPFSSKWNDAEKWIMNRQHVQAINAKKNAVHNQSNRVPITNMVRVAPLSANSDHRVNRVADGKMVDSCQPAVHMPFETFPFIPYGAQSRDSNEMVQPNLSCTKSAAEDATVFPAIRSVCMRDTGTEMTPVPSQEPSRTGTPIGATTPLRSPTSSVSSTPRRGAPTSTPIDSEPQHSVGNCKRELSEQEMKVKTRREIVALGVQLGKMNIAAWASKAENDKNASSVNTTSIDELERIEYENRAAAWEEVEKSRHTARYKSEEIQIQAWESQQRAKLEAELQRIEAKVEQMRARARAQMMKNIDTTRQRSEEKRAAAEARKNRDAERTAVQAEYIRRTGKIPSSHYMCCGWFS